MAINRLFFHLLILASISVVCRSDDADCVYTVYVKTGSIIKGGTNANITLSLYGANGYGIRINNLVSWGGIMGPGHDYFERGNIDIFSGRGPCLKESICKMNLTSDGTGSHPGWNCDYVEVTTTGLDKKCSQIHFKVDRWLATNAPPYNLTVIRNYCSRIGKEPVMHGLDLPVVSVM